MQNEAREFVVVEADLPAEGNMLMIIVDNATEAVHSTGNVQWDQIGGVIPANAEGGGSRVVAYSYGPFNLDESDGKLHINYMNPRQQGTCKAFLQEVQTGESA